MMSFLLVRRRKIISFLSKQLFFHFLMKNYCFNTFSSPGLGLKLQKCVSKVWWRHKPSFAIVQRQNVISFDWKDYLRRISRKHRLQTFSSLCSKTSFWSFDDVIMMPQAHRPKLPTGYMQFSTPWHIGNNVQ